MKVGYLSALVISFFVGACASENSNPYVDDRIKSLRGEMSTARKVQDVRKQTLNEMRDDIMKSNTAYKDTVNKIQSSLSMGAAPADKYLVDQWKTARMQLDRNNDVAFDMKMLVAELEKDVKILEYIDSSVKGMDKIPGKTKSEQSELNKISSDAAFVKSDVLSLIKRVDDEVDNNMHSILIEKENLNDLALSIKEGRVVNSGINMKQEVYMRKSGQSYSHVMDQKLTGSRSLIDIDMSKQSDYGEPLYHALSRALERDSSVSFQIMSVASNSDIAKKNIEKVMATLNEMKMPASRISIKSYVTTSSNPQVSIYAR